MTWKNQNVMVTGASSGIGAAIAKKLASLGATVALVARRKDRLDEVLSRCVLSAPKSQRFVADLSNSKRAGELADEIWEALGHLDIVINNAGIPLRRPVTRLSMDELEHVMTVNFFSPIAIALQVLPKMLERKSGTIMNISSLGGRLGIPNESAYCGSKFAMAGWCESAAADLADTGVSVKLVLPGAIDTEIWDLPNNDDPIYEGPLVPPDEFAEGILDALQDDGFEYYIPDMKAIIEMKTSDMDSFLGGMRDMARAGRKMREG